MNAKVNGINRPGFVEVLIPREGGVIQHRRSTRSSLRDLVVRPVEDLPDDPDLERSVTGAC